MRIFKKGFDENGISYKKVDNALYPHWKLEKHGEPVARCILSFEDDKRWTFESWDLGSGGTTIFLKKKDWHLLE